MSEVSVSKLILQNLCNYDEYTKKVLPFIDSDYFENPAERAFFSVVSRHYLKYNTLPDTQIIKFELEDDKNLPEQIYEESVDIADKLDAIDFVKKDLDWLVDKTETFCKEQAIFNALKESLTIIEGKGTKTKLAIPDILSKALGVSFDTHVGHFYFESAEDQWKYYHTPEAKVRTHIDILNKVLDGGASVKTLNMILAPTNAGKTAFMCDMAANNLRMGANVLYISLEMGEERIRERMDANLLDLEFKDIRALSEASYLKKISAIQSKTVGRLCIKEYPPSEVSAAHIEHLLAELKMKKGFVPDIIYVDYMNLMTSSRIKGRGNVNSAEYYKMISEELRGIAVKRNIPIWTANQFNRSGYKNTDADLTEMADSFATSMGADFIMALIRTDELDERAQVLIKQLKTRYSDMSLYKSFVVGVERKKFSYYDLEDSAQQGIDDDDKPVMDNSVFGKRDAMAQARAKSGNKIKVTF